MKYARELKPKQVFDASLLLTEIMDPFSNIGSERPGRETPFEKAFVFQIKHDVFHSGSELSYFLHKVRKNLESNPK